MNNAQQSAVLFLSYALRNHKFFMNNRLAAEDFPPRYDEIASAFIKLFDRGNPTDSQSVMNALAMGGIEEEMDSFYGSSLMEIETTRSTEYDAKIAHEKLLEWSKNNAIHKAAEAIFDMSRRGDLNSMQKLAMFSQTLEAATRKANLSAPKLAGEVAETVFEKIERTFNNGPEWGIRTGIEELDRMTMGFKPGEFVVIAARTSMGKSVFAAQIMRHCATHIGPAAILSFEMDDEELIRRFIAADTGVDVNSQYMNSYSKTKLEEIRKSTANMKNMDLYLENGAGKDANWVRTKISELVRDKGVKAVVVDHLGIVGYRGPHKDKRLIIGELTATLKQLASQLGIVIIGVNQINRSTEGRDDKRPQCGDLSESGNIEQDASAIIMIYRDDYYNENSQEKGMAEIIIRKQRNGRRGTVRVKFNGASSLFEELPRGYNFDEPPFESSYTTKKANAWESNPFAR